MSWLVKTAFQEVANFIQPTRSCLEGSCYILRLCRLVFLKKNEILNIFFSVSVRNKARKVLASVKSGGNCNAKHRGIKRHDGTYVYAGTILATQRKMRFHPGLNVRNFLKNLNLRKKEILFNLNVFLFKVGMGRNGTLFAMNPGKVVITSEAIDPNFSNPWVKKNYEGREGQIIYKKHFNIIPFKQHDRFILKDAV